MADYSLEEFLQIHESQLKASGVPEVFWPRLYEKLKAEELDAGDSFQIVVEQNEQEGTSSWSVHTIKDIVATDPNNIYLIDHAWTFRPNSARKTLTDFPVLKERLMKVFDISEEDFGDGMSCSDYVGSESGEAAKPEEKEPNKTDAQNGDDASSDIGEDSATPVDDKIIGAILDKIWLYAQTYTVKVRQSTIDESDLPVWYVPDEFGMRIGHSRDPNFRVVPFFYVFQNMSFSLLFPIKDVGEQGEVTRLYVENQFFRAHPEWYDVLMHPWEPVDVSARPITFAPKDDNYFQSGRIPDELPSTFEQENVPPKPANGKLKVFATHAQLFEGLKHIEVDFVDDPFSADVVWMREHFHDFKSLAEKNPGALINQFPYESVLTVKDLLAASVQAAYGSNALNEETLAYLPDWLPVTFNLNMELPQFVSYFQRREQRNLDNTWIVKPWNLARGLDTHVTRNLNCIIRLAESGPKIVSKYIERPVLFRRPDSGNLVKFDLRYIVLLRSLQPLEIAIYNKFWIRFAINEFSLNNLDDFFTHLTVFNYAAKDKVLDMKCEEFIDQIEKLYPALHWQAVQKKVNQVLVDVFKTVSSNPAPRGLVPNKQSRAMYGIDVMLHWNDDEQKDVGVSFIEANFMPDCERACQYYPDFADTVFSTLFINETPSDVTVL
ncbi:CBN-TTLL-12 protein [Aphelenchoides avenae]|nr:CBN-TTLL-12 protein [Aphelenchus avenae]